VWYSLSGVTSVTLVHRSLTFAGEGGKYALSSPAYFSSD
jgi:hypothetical protein